MKLNPTLVKLRDRFRVIKKIESFRQYYTNHWEKWTQNRFEGGLSTVNRPYQMKEEYY